VNDGPNRQRNVAVLAVLIHGFRAKEARLMLLRNVIMPKSGESQGHFIIESEDGTKRGTAGVRIVPMEPVAREAIQRYVRQERPSYKGSGRDEPLFLADDGEDLTASGWHAMAQRLRRMAKAEGVEFKQHRLRSTRARLLHEADIPDSAIMEMLGWSSIGMLRRYLGTIPISRLKQYPTTLSTALGMAG
jgi:integrase